MGTWERWGGKSHLGSFLDKNETEPRAGLAEFIPTGSQEKKSTGGAFVVVSGFEMNPLLASRRIERE